jgi:predicted nucleic acid-binding protein
VIVIDASALADVLLGVESARRVEDRMFDDDEMLAAPHLIDLEILQVLRRFAAQGDWYEQRARDALDDFKAIRIDRHAHDAFAERIWELRENVTAYDAAYIALAETLGCPLVTRDRKLAKAPGHEAKVEVL